LNDCLTDIIFSSDGRWHWLWL